MGDILYPERVTGAMPCRPDQGSVRAIRCVDSEKRNRPEAVPNGIVPQVIV